MANVDNISTMINGGESSSALRKALEQCAMVQSMIDISAEHLDGLRTQCATSAELTQQEIRTLEGKLIKLFSRQLLAKSRIREAERTSELKQYPQLKQWLTVVGLRRNSAQGICQKVSTLEDLLKLSDHEIKNALRENSGKDEEERRLIVALQNLRRCTECLRQGEKDKCNELDLHWDSWDRVSSSGSTCSSPKPPRPRPLAAPVFDSHLSRVSSNPTSPPMTNSVPNLPWSPGASSLHGGPTTFAQLPRHDHRYTPPPTPPTSSKKGEKMRFPTTPPPRKRHQTAVTSLLPDSYPLTKSKSHESQLANKIDLNDPGTKADRAPRRPRLLTEPGLESDQDETSTIPALISSSGGGGSSSLTNSPMRMSPHPYAEPHHTVVEDATHRSQLIAPPSPRTPTLPMVLPQMTHRFKQIIKMTPCDICKKQMIIGLKCKECKLRCHHNCADKIALTPCLPTELLNFIRMHNDGNRSPILARLMSSPIYRKDGHRDRNAGRQYPLPPLINAPGFQAIDTSSNTSSSSCNSSTPSSPAPNSIMGHTPPILPPHHFDFSDLTFEKNITIDARPLKEVNEMVETQKSNDSDKTMSGTSGSTDSEKTLAGRVDSQDSQVSDIDSFDRSWPRQNSDSCFEDEDENSFLLQLSFREWEIPYNELVFGEAVGTGRFGTVYRGNWHGEIAIKVFNMDQMDDENALDSFKQEVATFRKTRHENLVLFMGACMKPPHLAIVTRLCKGMTLYTHIHLRHDKFNLNRAIIIAQQVAQGMGYLHARGIVHKDLKTKNVFLESGKVVITDFGLFSVTKLCHGNRKGDWLTIPPGWLCYLAPEVVSCLRASNESHANDNIPFTKASDVYAFGTVWYELVCSEWPFKGQPPEAIIWQVGKGMKQSLANLQASRDVKDILMMCWCYKSAERPEFSTLPKLLEKLPKKRLARSPSHPIQLSRSAESVF